ncbi:MAG: 3-phosphoshikimate 1-carboxyvinyltransferase, partial [Acutalibacteraceae bacterium]|nr:3-phosphoshikimate 1-carboxyvinyltransferase [Acutalibacteraceae bacterium]
MIVSFEKSTAFGEILAPPSKSMAHRYLICGALSDKSEIKNIDFSEDIKATLSCLEALG